MKRCRRLCALLLMLALAVVVPFALAAEGGSAADPLVSLDYAKNTYAPALRQTLFQKTAALANGQKMTLSKGGTLRLNSGAECTLLSGSAEIAAGNGVLLDLSRGTELQSGSLRAKRRYLAAEEAAITLRITQNAVFLVNGDVTGSGSTTAGSFWDVPETHWAGSYIARLSQAGLVNGMGDGKFAPDSSMTRGQLVTVLGRLAKIDTGAYTALDFPDVQAGDYYAPYVAWAKDNGIVSGMDDGKFHPGDNVSREQIAALVVRFAQRQQIQLSQGGMAAPFSDHDSIAPWARDAVYQARQAGILNGRDNGAFAPKESASRAEVCAVIGRLMDLM